MADGHRYNDRSLLHLQKREDQPIRLLPCALLCALLCLMLRPATAQTQPDPHFYDYDAQAPFTATDTAYKTIEGVPVRLITYPSPVVTKFPADNTVTAYYFMPSGPGPHPAMIVLHEWLPVNLKNEFVVAAQLAKAQIAALVIVQPFSLNRRPVPHVPEGELLSGNVPQMIAGIHQCVLDVRRGIDWLSQRPDIDPQRLGITGISIGGIIGPLVAGVDPRLKYVVPIDGGGDVADLVWSSPFLKGFKPELLRRGYTRESLKTALVNIEPTAWLETRNFDPHNALMFNGRYDVFVKPDQARLLSKALGGAPIAWLNTGHYGLAFSMKRLNATGIDFLKSRFFADAKPFQAPSSIPSHTLKLGFLLGGHEVLSPAIALQVFNFDKEGRFSLDGNLTYRGLSAGLSARVNRTDSVGLELPLLKRNPKIKPYVLFHIVL